MLVLVAGQPVCFTLQNPGESDGKEDKHKAPTLPLIHPLSLQNRAAHHFSLLKKRKIINACLLQIYDFLFILYSGTYLAERLVVFLLSTAIEGAAQPAYEKGNHTQKGATDESPPLS